MGFFQRIGNAIARFMYGRNGPDQLGLATFWAALILDILSSFVGNDKVYGIISIVTTVAIVWAFFRMLSKNLPKRRAENAWFCNKIYFPIKRKFTAGKQQRADKEHKYFTCPQCRTVCRVPRGKGKIVITCPKCRHEIKAKT